MPYITVSEHDARTVPTAYVTDGQRRNLYEVIDDQRGVLVLENCRTGARMTIGRVQITGYHLVRAAPVAPDFLEEEVPVNSD